MTAPEIDIRRPWRPGETLFLIGPGGVGKSTLGRALSQDLAWPLLDLDHAFCTRLGIIGPYIEAHGYERYRADNLALAQTLVAETAAPMVFVTASGFFAAPAGTRDHTASRLLVGTGYGIALLPSRDMETAATVVVERQLTRGFGLERESEDRKFRQRFPIYRNEGDALVISTAAPEVTARALIAAAGIAP